MFGNVVRTYANLLISVLIAKSLVNRWLSVLLSFPKNFINVVDVTLFLQLFKCFHNVSLLGEMYYL